MIPFRPYVLRRSYLKISTFTMFIERGAKDQREWNEREKMKAGDKTARSTFLIRQPLLKVEDSRPARSVGRVKKKSCFKTLENLCVCYEGSILSYKVIKIHPFLRTSSRSPKTRKRKFYQNVAKTSFSKPVIVVMWSVTPTFHFFFLFPNLKRA